MTLIDSADSVLMLHSYAGAPVWPIKIFTWQPEPQQSNSNASDDGTASNDVNNAAKTDDVEKNMSQLPTVARYNDELKGSGELEEKIDETKPINTEKKLSVMSGLSILLTLLSILVAFRCVLASYL